MAASPRDQMRFLVYGVLAFFLLGGWVFILSQNAFHLTPPVVFVCLGYLAVVATVFNLWRTGASVFQPEDGTTWARPIGARGELDKEKKTLLKAIKEAEFDHAMGKLSQADADQLIRTYRARAIEVIKEIDRLDAGTTGSVRERIAREVKARAELAEKAKKRPQASGLRPQAGEAPKPAKATAMEEKAPAADEKAVADETKPAADEAVAVAKAEEPAAAKEASS